MRNIQVILLALIIFLSIDLKAQYSVSGILTSVDDSLPINECKLVLSKKNRFVSHSDSLGKFSFSDVPNGSYILHIHHHDFKGLKQEVIVNGENVKLNFKLKSHHRTTEVVTVTASRQTSNRMKGVENMGIYEGKKTEVIEPDKLTANLSTNNARQIYARVPGLNIFENDGSGLQLSVGARGLDPNRTSNFNVRQNGYDISADALGYPESYYTPPTEAIEKIQIVRGAASLQYGTQFGGLINFMIRKPVTDKKIQLTARQSVGTFGFYNTFTSLSGTVNKLSYYTYFQYKRGDGWRQNSGFNNYNFFTNVNYKISERQTIGLDFTHMNYLAQQAGGLSDRMFEENPRQSNRDRNWFKVNWNLLALHYNYKINESNEFNLRMFGLSAYRYAIGFSPNRVENIDFGTQERDLIKGNFTNFGAEARYLKWYNLFKKQSVFLLGARYYHGYNHSTQGSGSKGKDADFNYITSNDLLQSNYVFPNNNVSLFIENIVNVSDKFSITPGIRYEYIHTVSDGSYGVFATDLAGNKTLVEVDKENRNFGRGFLLAGVGLSYLPIEKINLYTNISQNYRSITFSDMQIVNTSLKIDSSLQDETGYSFDLGIRSEGTKKINFDLSFFYINYANKIGVNYGYPKSVRTNIGEANLYGLESFIELDILKILNSKSENWSSSVFANVALINSEYIKSNFKGVEGNQVEFVPNTNLKYGYKLAYKKFKTSLQYNYTASQFSEATNADATISNSVIGIIPAYEVVDLSMSYEFKMFKIEGSINNLGNTYYYTRRATGYPGPGILPSDGRSFYLTLQFKI